MIPVFNDFDREMKEAAKRPGAVVILAKVE